MIGKKTWIAFSIALFSLSGIIYGESELNDNANTANTLEIQGSGSGRLGDSTGPSSNDIYDWYVVTTVQDGKLTINVSTSGGLDVQPYIYCSVEDKAASNPSGDWISPDGDAVNDSVKALLRAGTVYIQLIRRSGMGTYSISAVFNQALLSNDAEMNDTVKLALPLGVNATATGHLGYYSTLLKNDVVDWYKINVPSNGRLQVTTVTSGGNLDLQPYIYRSVSDTNGTNPSGDWSSPSGDTIRDTLLNALHAGVVWVQVLRRAGVGSYEIKTVFTPAALTNDTEMNDTARLAQSVAINTPFTGHMGYYSTALGFDAYDWFRFSIPDEGKISISSLTSDGNLNLRFYIYRHVADTNSVNPSGDYTGSTGDTLADSLVDYLRAGTYYLQVIRDRGVGSYTITPVFEQARYAADVEPNNTPAQANTLAYNAVATGRMGYYSHQTAFDVYDWHAITVPSPCTLKVRIVTTGTLVTDSWIYSVVSDMNSSNPSGTYVSGRGNGTNDTISVYAVPGTTYYVQMRQTAGVGSYVIASGSADPVVSIIDLRDQHRDIKKGTSPVVYELSSNVPVAIRIFDLQGRMVLNKVISTKKYHEFFRQLQAGNLKKGLYMVEVTSNGARNIKKLRILK